MIDYTIKGKLRFNNPLTFTESHILYDCVEKLEKIEQVVKEWESSKIVINCYECAEQIREVIKNGNN